MKTTVTFPGGTESESENGEYDVKFKNTVEESDFDTDEFVSFHRALDYGLNVGLGYTAGPVLLSANYSLGLGNTIPGYDGGGEDFSDDNKMTNKGFSVSATYFFNCK